MLPACIWFYDHGHYRKQGMLKRTYYILNGFLLLLGAFVTTAGSKRLQFSSPISDSFIGCSAYAAVVGIKDAYKSGEVGSAFRYVFKYAVALNLAKSGIAVLTTLGRKKSNALSYHKTSETRLKPRKLVLLAQYLPSRKLRHLAILLQIFCLYTKAMSIG